MTVKWDTPGLIARLIELHGYKDLTMTMISEKLSFEFEQEVGRNAVIGRVHRLKLEKRPSPPPPGRKPKLRIRPMIVDAPIAPEPEPKLPEPNVLTIYQLKDGVCHWPLGDVDDRPPFFYCGKPAVREGASYCQVHHEKAHGAPARVVWT